MKRTLIIAGHHINTAFRDNVFVIITGLFLALSILSVFIGASTKNAEMQAYQDIMVLLQAQGAATLPEAPVIMPLSILKNIIEYIVLLALF